MGKYPNWDLLKNTTKAKFFGSLILFFLFSSIYAAQAESTQIDNTYHSKLVLKNNRGFPIENLRTFKEGLLYSSQNEIFFNTEKINLESNRSDEFKINNLITDKDDFYLLSSAGLHKNFQKVFGKEECFHLEQNKKQAWLSCKSGIYSSQIKDGQFSSWDLDEKSPQGVIFFTLNKSRTKPKYAASPQLGFYKYHKKDWQKNNTGLKRNPQGDFGFSRFLVRDDYGIETIYLPTSYGIAISNNQGKSFFVDDEGIDKEFGFLKAKEINIFADDTLVLICNSGFYTAKLELVPTWSKQNFPNLRKSENNFNKFSAIDIKEDHFYLASAEGEIVKVSRARQSHHNELYGTNLFNSKELIEKLLDLEPEIAELHKRALDFAGIPTGKNYRSYIRKARLRNLAPSFDTYIEKDNDDFLSIETSGSDDLDGSNFSTSFDKVNQDRRNDSLNTGLRFSWDLRKVFYDEEIVDINNSARLTANIRENLLTEVTQLYFQRKEKLSQAISWILNKNKLRTESEVLKEKLKLEESLAQLDARTGSWYSKALSKKLSSFHKERSQSPELIKAMELYSYVKIN